MKMVFCLIVGRGGKSTRDKGLIFFSSTINGLEAEKLSKKNAISVDFGYWSGWKPVGHSR